jgi:P2 family phage contractile tail tube protein
MSQIKLNRITNANIYFDGNSLLGRAEEIKLPEISAMMTEHKALGMVGKIELPSGFDKMEGDLKWNSFYEDAWLKVANPFASVQLQCRSNVETYTAQGRVQQQALVTFLTVAFKKNPLGTFKQHDNAEFNSAFACYYIRQQLNGVDVVEFDAMANIYKVGGIDQLDIYRANLGG